EAMSAARHALRQQRNSLLPVARLPPEILRTIFAFSSEIDLPWIENGVRIRLGWLAVTHVCRRWRVIAVEHTALWTDFSWPLGPGWTEAFAERARTMPLMIRF
ncbi:hypothetical protein FA95DRAFT_1471938, partial [Auriscalpium vulgare]